MLTHWRLVCRRTFDAFASRLTLDDSLDICVLQVLDAEALISLTAGRSALPPISLVGRVIR